jgi:hypothetical protein
VHQNSSGVTRSENDTNKVKFCDTGPSYKCQV